ncbi:hypothetical protein CP967_31190 [Streptomyces nitrosporeus]|uniref:Uncharacterized protein n=2 Tax=Streptomyces nitrosporeus TaxID=28894 RepID=A0A5J6FJ44_9ACTN|nr:hypothetical protein CP967_31190 [Streptomyces nitrosporeus]
MLELDDIRNESESTLVARGAAYAREYDQIQGKSTLLLKNLAITQIALRLRYDDVAGRSGPYRATVASMYSGLGVPADRITQTQASVRWHINNLLRRYLTPRELEKYDLQPTSLLERQQDARQLNSAIVKASKAASAVEESTPKPAKKAAKGTAPEPASPGQPVKATSDHLRLAEVAKDIVGKMDRTVITKHMTDGQRAKLDKELAALERKIASLRKLTHKPRSGA